MVAGSMGVAMKMRVVTALTLALWVHGAAGAPYWPESPGAVLHYSDGSTITIGSGVDMWSLGPVTYAELYGSCTKHGHYGVDEDGDVYTSSGTIICGGWFDPDFWGGGVAVKILDQPLYIGKSWSNTYDQGWSAPFTVIGGVLGSGWLSTPEEKLFYYEVMILGASQYVDGVYWVNERYGPVRLPRGATFVGATGTVAAEASTWGEVKLLFR